MSTICFQDDYKFIGSILINLSLPQSNLIISLSPSASQPPLQGVTDDTVQGVPTWAYKDGASAATMTGIVPGMAECFRSLLVAHLWTTLGNQSRNLKNWFEKQELVSYAFNHTCVWPYFLLYRQFWATICHSLCLPFPPALASLELDLKLCPPVTTLEQGTTQCLSQLQPLQTKSWMNHVLSLF